MRWHAPRLGVGSRETPRALPPLESRTCLGPPAAALPDARLRLLPRLPLGPPAGSSSLLLRASDWLALASGGATVASACWLHCHWCPAAEQASSTLRQRQHSSSCARAGGCAGEGDRRPGPPDRCAPPACLLPGARSSGSARSPQPSCAPAPAVASMPAASSCTPSSIACTSAMRRCAAPSSSPASAFTPGATGCSRNWGGGAERWLSDAEASALQGAGEGGDGGSGV